MVMAKDIPTWVPDCSVLNILYDILKILIEISVTKLKEKQIHLCEDCLCLHLRKLLRSRWLEKEWPDS